MRRFTWPFGSRMASRGRSTSGSYARAQAGSSVIQSTSGRELTSGLTRGCSGPRPRLALAVRNRVELATGAAAAEPPHEVTLASDEGGGRVSLGAILVGKELARQLGIAVGDTVSVISPLGTPSPVAMVPRIKRFVVRR